MSDKIEVRLRQTRYGNGVPLDSVDVREFLVRMEKFGRDYLGLNGVTVYSPTETNSIVLEFDLEEGDK